MRVQYQCCFCGQAIEPIGPDVGGLVYTTNADDRKEKQHDQQLWCHGYCLQRGLHPSVQLYVLDLAEMRDGEETPKMRET